MFPPKILVKGAKVKHQCLDSNKTCQSKQEKLKFHKKVNNYQHFLVPLRPSLSALPSLSYI